MNEVEKQFLPGISTPRLFLIVALIIACFMPSNDSIWIDEAQTAAYARQPTFDAWQNRLRNDIASEAQMPMGMFVAWLGGKILGTSEWQLRAINLLWIWATIWIVWLIGRRFRAPALALVAAAQPFLWFYANEARPYSLQIAGGTCLLLAGLEFNRHRRSGIAWVWLWASAAIVLSSSSMLGVIPVAVLTAWMIYTTVRTRVLPSLSALLIAAGTAALLALLGGYYLWTLRRGAGGAQLWPVGLPNLGFSIYELFGFAGLGPTRQALRNAAASEGVGTMIRSYGITLALLAVVLGGILARVLAWFRRPEYRGFFFLLLGVPLLSACLLFALAKTVHFPFWGRHLAPIAPFLIVGLGLPALHSKRLWAKIACLVWIALLFVSSLQLRYAPRHRKDDNRSAAALANAVAAEQAVWWALDRRSGEYYGTAYREPSTERGVFLLPGISEEKFAALAPPDLVFTSKPETLDASGRVANYIATHGYIPKHHFQAITGWVKP